MSETTGSANAGAVTKERVVSFNPGAFGSDVKAFFRHPTVLMAEKLAAYVVAIFGVANPSGAMPTTVREAAIIGSAFVVGMFGHKAVTGN